MAIYVNMNDSLIKYLIVPLGEGIFNAKLCKGLHFHSIYMYPSVAPSMALMGLVEPLCMATMTNFTVFKSMLVSLLEYWIFSYCSVASVI